MAVVAPGYLLTWHTYGTWLHGDAAGSVDRAHNRFGTPRLAADEDRFKKERGSLKHPPLVLDSVARILVDDVMREHCRVKGWTLLALAVRSNHVHIVIGEPPVAPEIMVQQLKQWATRKLRSHRIVGMQQRVWADHASTLYLFEPGSVEQKVRYVLDMQDEPPEGHGRKDWDVKLGLRG